jgi:FMN phosphatase YigB (HAD superfamily)
MISKIDKKLRGVKFVYFDVGNVLFSFSGGLETLAKKFARPLGEIKTYWRSKDDDMCRGKLDPQEFWKLARNRFKYIGDDINFIDFWVSHFTKIQKGHDLAYKLSRDFQVGLLTNAYPQVIEKVLPTGLMPEIKWSQVVKSCDYKFVKPERELFDVALEKTGFKANEVILIDDLEDNCDKAVENGWKSIVFK